MNAVQLEMWQLILLLIAFFGCVAGFGKLLLAQFESRLAERFESQDEKFKELKIANDEDSRQWLQLERELSKLRIELPREYMRREDFIRQEVTVNAKLDALNGRLDLFLQRQSLIKES